MTEAVKKTSPRKDKPELLLPAEVQIWDIAAVAAYFGYSISYTEREIITATHFPPICPVPTNRPTRKLIQRWRAKDVIQYAMTFDKSTCKYDE